MDLARTLADIAEEIDANAAAIEAEADAKDAEAAPGPFGIAVALCSGEVLTAGSVDKFPIQSIGKVFAVDLALRAREDRVFERVGREPSGDPFNSLVDLERTHGLPRNPFINAGALVVVDMLVEEYGEAAQGGIVKLIEGEVDGAVTLDEAVLSEGGDLNRAMLSFMRHHENILSADDAIMGAYARQCAISLDVAGLARAGRFLAATRRDPDDLAGDCRARQTRTVLALMMTCGHYDASGDFAVRVGLPAKSGVGGGILAIAPQIASMAAWSPNLDQHGNSILGVRALEMLVARTGWSVFGPPLSDA
ncbi:glutaminase A [Sphingomonas sp. LR60]|uniref:glutaminase A n=1 Tax=Sphingomonas sp. LR60 TaxID=3050233 RepID=UPI002FE2EE3B